MVLLPPWSPLQESIYIYILYIYNMYLLYSFKPLPYFCLRSPVLDLTVSVLLTNLRSSQGKAVEN